MVYYSLRCSFLFLPFQNELETLVCLGLMEMEEAGRSGFYDGHFLEKGVGSLPENPFPH